MLTATYPLALSSGITVQHLGQEILLYNEHNHHAFCLNPTTAAVWQQCNGRQDVNEIQRAVSLALHQPVSVEVVTFALGELTQQGLLATQPVALPPPIARRALLQSLGASSLLLVPAIAILATPKAAQAYGGCANCVHSSAQPSGGGRVAKQRKSTD